MGRKAKVITVGFREEYRNCEPEENIKTAMEMLESFEAQQPDLVCFPETFLNSGRHDRPSASTIPGLTEKLFEALSKKAKKLKTYIIAGTYENINSNLHNVAWLIDRNGNLAGRYIKYYPTIGEIENGIIPGNDVPVFKTDFGTIGMLICFDIDYPEIWRKMASKGAEMVVWLSAYEGGFPLQTYAALHFYYVISTSRVSRAKIIDINGKVLGTAGKWMDWVGREINLEKTIFHGDGNRKKIYEIQAKLGKKVQLEYLHEQGRFILESNDPDWPIERIKREFNMETFKEYHKRTECVQKKARIDVSKLSFSELGNKK